MARPPLSRPRGAYVLAIVAVAVAATFGIGHGPERVAHSDRTESVATTGSPVPAVLIAGHTNPSNALITTGPAKERRIVVYALLVGAALIASLDRSRRRARTEVRDQPALNAFFARRRGPPSLRLAR